MRWAAVLVCSLATMAGGQVISLTDGSAAPAAGRGGVSSATGVRTGAVADVRFDALRAVLRTAPAEQLGRPLREYGLALELPDPAGVMRSCFVAESPVMAAELGARFPEISTYIVRSADGRASGRMEVSQAGLTAMLRGVEGVWMIDPRRAGDPSRVVARWLADMAADADKAGTGGWPCGTIEGAHGRGQPPEVAGGAGNGIGVRGPEPTLVTRRTMRLAVACTGEYGRHQCDLLGHAPNVADPLAAMVVTVSRVNVIYEADIALHFDLIAGNDRIIYVDPATDPYPDTCDGTGGADCSSAYMSPNAVTLNNVIGSGNFDVGHLLTRVYGGVANLSSACTPNRARGISGIARGGDVESLAFLVMVHELGHQFGASHTFSGTRGRCAGNVTLSSAWEAGSGSSPMAYPGGCPVGDAPPSDNVAIFADPYFHHGSLAQIRPFLNGIGCPTQQVTTNHTPVIVASTGDVAIPPDTPFVLSADATDADGDPLTYSWEEFDSGAARPLSGEGSADNGVGALFRAFPPVASGQRTFPRMADVLSGSPTPGEQLPTTTGVSRRFRVVVRDGREGAGGTATSAFATLTIPAGSAPFAVTSPAAEERVPAGSNTVTWSVGGTDLAPISCASVTIRLSTDDGATFPTLLGTFHNAGSASVHLPGNVEAGRLRISAEGNIFFAVSPRFSVQRCPADVNGVGGVTVEDLFEFLFAYFSRDPLADVNGSGGVTVQDIFDYLKAYFGGC